MSLKCWTFWCLNGFCHWKYVEVVSDWKTYWRITNKDLKNKSVNADEQKHNARAVLILNSLSFSVSHSQCHTHPTYTVLIILNNIGAHHDTGCILRGNNNVIRKYVGLLYYLKSLPAPEHSCMDRCGDTCGLWQSSAISWRFEDCVRGQVCELKLVRRCFLDSNVS